jgi:DNA-damage-inducible protein D
MTQEIQELLSSFESIKQVSEDWYEYWSARDLQGILWYAKWENFLWVIAKGKVSCNEAWNIIEEHFPEVRKPLKGWQWAVQNVLDYELSRYACYLAAQNGDSKKSEIAFAQAYFAFQTRRQEMIEQKMLDLERLRARKKLTTTERGFQELAFDRWVDWRGIWRIRSKWDRVLFWGNSTGEMKKKLWVKSWPLADVLPTVTLKAKDLATEVTNHNMKAKSLHWENQITQEHLKNNQWVRKFLDEGDIVPENLPAEEDLKKIERKHKSEEKKLWKKN